MQDFIVKQYLLVLMTLLLAACTSTGDSHGAWSVEDINREVSLLTPYVEQKKVNGQPKQVITAYAHEYGSLGNWMMRGLDGGKSKNFVRTVLLIAHARPNDYGVLYMTNNIDMDYTVILNAMKGLDLQGVKFFFAGRPADRTRFEPLVKASGADFIFIDKTQKPD